MPRKLASVQTVTELRPIEGADRIELASVLGWHVIVKKDEFKAGDKCVYVEIDSVLPEQPQFEFLRSRGFRIRTMKMRGVLSQGIAFPLSILPPGDYFEGDDVTEVLGVTQYEPAMDVERPAKERPPKHPKAAKFLMRFKWYRDRLDKKQSRAFPDFIGKTDEVRIQSAPFLLEDKTPYIVTEKLDGQSGTYALVYHKRRLPFLKPKEEYIVCSRNVRLFSRDDSNYWRVSDEYRIRDALRRLQKRFGTEWVAVQGEIIAPNVQKNKYGVLSPMFFVFNVITPFGRLGSVEAEKEAGKVGLSFVPILDEDFRLPDTVDEMVKYADGVSMINATPREGVVVRSADGRISFKAVSNEFLLKWKE